MKNLKFESMDLMKETRKALFDMGFENATPIQSMAILPALAGKDVIGQAQTGTGKTLAYAIPAVEMLEEKNLKPQFLVLCPTRELAIQVTKSVENLLKYRKRANVVAIYGGQQIDLQIRAIKRGAQIIVGTPGRVMDHMRRRTLRFDNLKMIVLDEADEMLNMGFIDDIKTILSDVPEERQTALFSATMPRAILELSKTFQKNQEFLKATHKKLVVENVEQFYFRIREGDKTELISRLLNVHNPESAIIFCNTKRKVDELATTLRSLKYRVEALHGDLRQPSRDRVMSNFRNRRTKILIATDVAARGIDVDDVEIIFNYDLPQYHEYYVHRVGRTGRMGKSGTAFTFVTSREMDRLKIIQRYSKADIKLAKIPKIEDLEKSKMKILTERIGKNLAQKDAGKYAKTVNELVKNGYSPTEIAIALLRMVEHSGDTSHSFIHKEIKEDVGNIKLPSKNGSKKSKKEKRMLKFHTRTKRSHKRDRQLYRAS